jgi:hypothetical protein
VDRGRTWGPISSLFLPSSGKLNCSSSPGSTLASEALGGLHGQEGLYFAHLQPLSRSCGADKFFVSTTADVLGKGDTIGRTIEEVEGRGRRGEGGRKRRWGRWKRGRPKSTGRRKPRATKGTARAKAKEEKEDLSVGGIHVSETKTKLSENPENLSLEQIREYFLKVFSVFLEFKEYAEGELEGEDQAKKKVVMSSCLLGKMERSLRTFGEGISEEEGGK